MLLVITSAHDPELPLLTAQFGTAILVPGHLSQPGCTFTHGGGRSGARLNTSRGEIGASDISGVLTRIQRVPLSDLAHIDPDDREYVAAEMTAFLAALLNLLPCPLLNRPTANSLWGPSWAAEYWWRVAASHGFPVCSNDDGACSQFVTAVVLGTNAMSDDAALPQHAARLSLLLATHAGVNLLSAGFCRRHQALHRVSLRPPLTAALLQQIETYCTRARGTR